MDEARVVPEGPAYSTLAIFSLIFAVLAWTVLPFMGLALAGLHLMNVIALPLTGSVIASVCGWLAQKHIRSSAGTLRGEGIAKAGRIMAYTQYLLVLILCLLVFLQVVLLPRHSPF
ncbi:hypothetical protein ACXU4B_01835 [Dyella soli]|uniref:Uncharacterized protein n=1 Tax=Dyella soli TaxID=522319 RepID=A0A4R0YU44_9GAMM|nr:hypothetical protein [Dyella soli]TCI09810.1 hypothetical protein EZM97_12700 [Dyella soli]